MLLFIQQIFYQTHSCLLFVTHYSHFDITFLMSLGFMDAIFLFRQLIYVLIDLVHISLILAHESGSFYHQNCNHLSQGCCSVVECLLSMPEAPSSIPTAAKKGGKNCDHFITRRKMLIFTVTQKNTIPNLNEKTEV